MVTSHTDCLRAAVRVDATPEAVAQLIQNCDSVALTIEGDHARSGTDEKVVELLTSDDFGDQVWRHRSHYLKPAVSSYGVGLELLSGDRRWYVTVESTGFLGSYGTRIARWRV